MITNQLLVHIATDDEQTFQFFALTFSTFRKDLFPIKRSITMEQAGSKVVIMSRNYMVRKITKDFSVKSYF